MRHLKPQPHCPRTAARGLTLVELMVGLAIAAFLMLSAAPYFGEYAVNSKLRESGNVLYGEALAAQSEAIKRNTTVRLSTSAGTVQVVDISVVDAPVVLRERQLAPTVTMSTASIDFGSEGRPVPFGTAGTVDVAMEGLTCSADSRCPGLRVDAGGSVRLCGDRTVSGC